MVYYHLQYYFTLVKEWGDLPHYNGGCSTDLSEILDLYDELINYHVLDHTRYRIIVSGRSEPLPLPKKKIPLYTQLSLF